MRRRALWGTLLLVACGDPGGDVTSGSGNPSGSGGTSVATSAETADESSSDATAAATGGSSDGDGETGEEERTGEELYFALCSACHGPEAEGTELGYELRHHDATHFTWVVRNGRPGLEFPNAVMAPFTEDDLGEEDLGKILAYLDAFPQPSTPEGLYLDYCANCHGPDGSGGSVDKEIVAKSFHDAQEKAREGIGLGSPGERIMFMPVFDPGRVTDAELQLIVDFIAE